MKPGITPELRAQILERDGHSCRAAALVPQVACFLGAPPQIHHVKRRWHGSDNPENLMTLCLTHHQWVTEHPADAHDLGLSKWSWE